MRREGPPPVAVHVFQERREILGGDDDPCKDAAAADSDAIRIFKYPFSMALTNPFSSE